jgi:DNA-binding transcriptional ArsR family regulator
MITFHLPPTAVERLAFAYSPVLEAVLSLHVLVEPKHHPLQHQWARQMRSLSPTLKREIAAFSFAYRSYFPAFLFPAATGTFATFESELTHLRTLAPQVLSFEFTETFSCGMLARDLARLEDPLACELILKNAATLEPKSLSLVKLALEEPFTLFNRFVDLLSAYWEAAFQVEWQRLEELLASDVAQAGARIAAHGLYAFLQGLWPEIRTDQGSQRFWLERPHEHEVVIGPDDQFVLVPSVYVWPHVRVNCDQPWLPSLVFPIAALKRAARPSLPPNEMLRVLRALADDTRLQVLRLIAERPRSTQELAPLVGLSEAALSKHLRLLAEAGVLQAQRTGYYVLYHLEPEQITMVMESLPTYLQTNASPQSPNVARHADYEHLSP